MTTSNTNIPRRTFLVRWIETTVQAAMGLFIFKSTKLGASPTCKTLSDYEGPFYSKGAPKISQLAQPGEKGRRITISGQVLKTDCKSPASSYILDMWQTNYKGEYDNSGYKLRGKVASKKDGSFAFETIMPGRYPGRPVRHIHLKIRRPDGKEVLTTQIYFKGDKLLSSSNKGPRVKIRNNRGMVNFYVET